MTEQQRELHHLGQKTGESQKKRTPEGVTGLTGFVGGGCICTNLTPQYRATCSQRPCSCSLLLMEGGLMGWNPKVWPPCTGQEGNAGMGIPREEGTVGPSPELPSLGSNRDSIPASSPHGELISGRGQNIRPRAAAGGGEAGGLGLPRFWSGCFPCLHQQATTQQHVLLSKPTVASLGCCRRHCGCDGSFYVSTWPGHDARLFGQTPMWMPL